MTLWNGSGEAVMSDETAPPDFIASLEELLQHRLGCRVRNLRVCVENGGLILQGQASTYYAKQMAQHWAMEVSHLPILANEIDVR